MSSRYIKPSLHERLAAQQRIVATGTTVVDGSAPVQYNRLSEDQCKALERELPAVFVNADTTAHQAGFLLGVQFVMQKLRQGFVIG